MCDRPMTWDELCAEMVKQRKRAEKAEAERDGYKNQIKAADNIIKTYGIDGPLPHDRVFTLIQHFEFEIEKLKEVLKWYAEKAHAITRFWTAKPPKIDAAVAIMTELTLDDGQRAHGLLEEKP